MSSLDSSGGIVTCLLAERSGFLIPAVAKDISRVQIFHTGSGLNPTSYLTGTIFLSWGQIGRSSTTDFGALWLPFIRVRRVCFVRIYHFVVWSC
jgi:hypothetical protein